MPYPDPNKLQTPLARVRGLGSAHSGVHHWWILKMTAFASLPLTLWLLWSIVNLAKQGATYDIVKAWIGHPVHAFLLCVLLGVNTYHIALGGQEPIVDYVHKHRYQLPAVVLFKMLCYGVGLVSIFTTLYIAFKL
jgi:succinate dehydrogenase / fumarate reductase membrane anchor subunit